MKQPSAQSEPRASNDVLWLLIILAAGLLIRLFLLPSQGHVTDIGSFESWTMKLNEVGFKAFYDKAGFVDYPPGYLLVLWCVGKLWSLWNQPNNYALLLQLCKLPAVLSDIIIAIFIYLFVKRQWPGKGALVAAAVFVLNPASWFVSAYWGQADSVAAVFLVLAIYLAVTERYEWAWAALAFAVLVKPQPLVTAPLFLIWQLRSRAPWRLVFAPVIGAAVAWLGSMPFAPVNDPVGVLSWLYDRYHTGISVYPYNSVNAFNLYSVVRDMWQPDTQIISVCVRNWCVPGLAFPQYDWGMGIFAVLLIALAWRLWRTATPDTQRGEAEYRLAAACYIALLGYFMLTTRVHERYMFSALAVAPLVWNRNALSKLSYVVLSTTFIFNLTYALRYLFAPSPDLNPFEVHVLSFVNVVALFALAGSYLVEEMDTSLALALSKFKAPAVPTSGAYRSVFEGLVGWSGLDYLIVGAFMLGASMMLFTGLNNPPTRYFDEIYYARAAQEYIQHLDLYEWTHPPFVKLLYAAGAWFFATFFHKGDPVGARMTSALCGVLTIPLLYGFGKRLLSSTVAASLAVFFLITGGYWYVQARIAQPETFMGFFALLTLYCAYRWIIASQFVARPKPVTYPAFRSIWAAVAAFIGVFVYMKVQAIVTGNAATEGASLVPYLVAIIVYGIVTVWLFARNRSFEAKRDAVVFADGVIHNGDALSLPNGERCAFKDAASKDDDATVTWSAAGCEVVTESGTLRRNRDGTIDGQIGDTAVHDSQPWVFWFVLTCVSVAAMVASKWYGLFDLACLWFVAALITAQQLLPALLAKGRSAAERFALGNPFGPRLSLFISAVSFTTLVVYVLSYIPNFDHAVHTAMDPSQGGHRGFAALIWLQSIMYHYHHDLVATHPYASAWWTWPFEIRPVSYYWHEFPGSGPNHLVSEIIALPNPLVWLAGVLMVPISAVFAWRERHKGMLFLVAAYVWQWLPWALSTRIDFEYNFYSNTAVMCLCTAYVMLRSWQYALKAAHTPRFLITLGWGLYAVACAWGFLYFLPILNATPIPWHSWDERMWFHFGAPNWYGWI